MGAFAPADRAVPRDILVRLLAATMAVRLLRIFPPCWPLFPLPAHGTALLSTFSAMPLTCHGEDKGLKTDQDSF